MFKGHTTKADKAAKVAAPAGGAGARRGRRRRRRVRNALKRTPRPSTSARSAQKAGLVLDLIRGKDVNDALATLRFAPQGRRARHREGAALGDRQRAAARTASAATSTGCSSTACYANQGPSQKRIRPAPMGRAFRVVKRTAHLTVRSPSGRARSRQRPEGGEAPRPKRAAPRRRAPQQRRAAKRQRKKRRLNGSESPSDGFRLGFNKTWRSRWFADKDYAKLLHEDLKLRDDLKKRLRHAGVSKIEIERAANKLKIDIYTSRPGHHHRPQGHGSRQAEARRSRSGPTARSSSTSRRSRSPSSTRSWSPSRWRCSSRSASRSAAR